MAIRIQNTSYNGTQLSYARVISIDMDFQTRESKVVMGGYQSRLSRQMGENPVAVMEADFIMPEPPPADLVAFTYDALRAAYPEMDFSEV